MQHIFFRDLQEGRGGVGESQMPTDNSRRPIRLWLNAFPTFVWLLTVKQHQVVQQTGWLVLRGHRLKMPHSKCTGTTAASASKRRKPMRTHSSYFLLYSWQMKTRAGANRWNSLTAFKMTTYFKRKSQSLTRYCRNACGECTSSRHLRYKNRQEKILSFTFRCSALADSCSRTWLSQF